MQDILNRTSVRRFLDRKIEPEKLKQILQAGFAAPSAKNGDIFTICGTNRQSRSRYARMRRHEL